MKKKILFILHTPPPVHGSSVIGLQIKNSGLINEFFNCRFINLSTSLTIEKVGKTDFFKIFRFISIWFKVLFQLLFFRPNTCYFAITVKGSAFYKDSIIVLLIKLFGIKIYYHLHNKGIASNQHRFFDNLLYKLVFKNCEVILLSKYLYPDIEKYINKENVNICPNGIPDCKFDDKSTHVNSSERKINILFLSNLIESKGVYVLLDACKKLHNKQIDFHCSFAGGIGDVTVNDFQKKIEVLNLQKHVTYLGVKYDNEKFEVFKQADIFAFPTYYHNETFGLVILEAMQHSLPVISTFEGGIPDVVENGITGYLVNQKNSDELAEKLEILIKNPLLRNQMGHLGYIKFKNEFTLKQFEANLVKILN